MVSARPKSSALRVADLSQNSETAFEIRPTAQEMDAIARKLDLLSLRKLSFRGIVRTSGDTDWDLKGTLGATVVQPCVITLEPVSTRIDQTVERRYVKGLELPDAEETEMPEDDTIEPLGVEIDPAQVMAEALALALPLYPRRDGADLDRASFAAPGVRPMSDDDVRPFASLAGMREAMKKKE